MDDVEQVPERSVIEAELRHALELLEQEPGASGPNGLRSEAIATLRRVLLRFGARRPGTVKECCGHPEGEHEYVATWPDNGRTSRLCVTCASSSEHLECMITLPPGVQAPRSPTLVARAVA